MSEPSEGIVPAPGGDAAAAGPDAAAIPRPRVSDTGAAPSSGEGDAPRPARTVPRPGGSPSVRKPEPAPAPASAERAPISEDSVPTVRYPPTTPDDAPAAEEPTEGPPDIERFLSPLPPAPRADSPSGGSEGSGSTRRRSRRTVKIPDDTIPHKTPQPPLVAQPEVAATPAVAPPAPDKPPTSDKPVFVIPPSPPVPTLSPRSAPRPAPKPVEPPPSTVPEAAAAAPEPPADTYEVIRPMRIINIGSQPPPDGTPVAPAGPPPPAPPPPVVSTSPEVPAEASWDDATDPEPRRVSRPPLPASPELDAFVPQPPSTQPAPAAAESAAAPPFQRKPPAVEEVEAIDDEESETGGAATLRTEEIESIPDDEIVPDRISGHSEPDEIPVVVEAAPAVSPKKPPPPPPKRTSGEPPPSTPQPPSTPTAQTRPAEPAAPALSATVDLGGRKRQKPWWEEIFSDDYLRTMERIEPKVVRKESDFIEDRLGLEKGAVMLDLACGEGAHAVELSSRGYNVVGYDLSLAMLARAQDEALDRGQKINFLQGDMREMAFEEAFDGIYCWNTSFGYFDDEKNLNVLSRIRRGLRQGGLFLLDVANRDYVCPRQPSLVWFEGDGCVCMDEMHVDFFTSRLRVKRTVMFEDGRARECDYAIRLYALHELGKMLHETGFKVVEVTGHPAHPGVFFGSESPRIIVLAERA